jgi:aminocarboxymuconate-semialdehyde decarboxylase
MIDTVGVERIVLGSDWPYDMGIDQPVEWVNSLQSLTQEEKEAILWKNLEKLLGI